MRRAEKQITFPWQPVFPVLLLVALAVLGWREYLHGSASRDWKQTEAGLEESVLKLESRGSGLEAQLAAAESSLEKLEIERQSLTDRAGNLEAQRDHLRTELERRLEEARAGETVLTDLRRQLEEARLAQLEAERRPENLEAAWQAEQSRNQVLEKRIDDLAVQLADAPPLLEVGDRSRDGSVFTLHGDWEAGQLPVQVLFGQQDRILLEGWINRREADELVAHAGRWHSDASALVKGQKVFILPVNRHEAD